MNADQVGLLACWYGSTGETAYQASPIGMQLWYASNETTFEELEWVGGAQSWAYQQTWTDLNGHASPGCYSWGPTGKINYVTFIDLDNRVNFYWYVKFRCRRASLAVLTGMFRKDVSSNLLGTPAHPVNQWVNCK